MNRNEALEIARQNHAAYRKATIENLFRNGPKVDNAAYGYHHGWFTVGEFCFCDEEITGIAYDHTQGGWAFV